MQAAARECARNAQIALLSSQHRVNTQLTVRAPARVPNRLQADETAVAERGMNEQMSLLELRERLAVLQRRQKEEVRRLGKRAAACLCQDS